MIAPAHPWTVTKYIVDVYVRERLDLSPGTIHNLKIVGRQLDAWNEAPFNLNELSREAIIDWMRWLADVRHASPATINGKRGLVMAVWTDAAGKGYAPPAPSPLDPRERVPKRIEPERIPVTWSLQELDKIFSTCGTIGGKWEDVPVSSLWVLALLLFWDTGCRLAEVVRARMQFLDAERRLLLCPAENRKGRRKDRLYLLHPQTIEAFRATLPSTRERVFPFPYGERALQRHFSKILNLAGLPCDRKHKFHCIRRSAESYAAAERGLQWAADAVGHNVAVAKKSYVSPIIAPGPVLIDALPRPSITLAGDAAMPF